MVSWSMDDAMVITAVSDLSIKVWNSYTGTLLQVLEVGAASQMFLAVSMPSDMSRETQPSHNVFLYIFCMVGEA